MKCDLRVLSSSSKSFRATQSVTIPGREILNFQCYDQIEKYHITALLVGDSFHVTS